MITNMKAKLVYHVKQYHAASKNKGKKAMKVEPHGQEPVAPVVWRNPPKLQSSFARASEDTRIPPRPGDRGFLRRRVKNMKVGIRSEKELFDEVGDVWGKLEKGEKIKKHKAVYFESLEAMRKVLTVERLRIVKTIKKEHPSSIYELARILGRDVKNTSNDVQFLAQAGLVELTKTKNGRERTTPTVKYDKILLEIQV
jgi:predicted transcriptional regulator